MWMVTDNNELCHYGTPRHSGRFPFGSGKRPFQSLVESGRKKAAEKKKKKEYEDKKKFKRQLTIEELEGQIRRLKLEKDLTKLTDENIQPGKEIVKNVLSRSGQKVAEKVLTESGIYAISGLVKAFGNKELADMIKKKDK